MRFGWPLILLAAIAFAAFGIRTEIDARRSADRAPAAVAAPREEGKSASAPESDSPGAVASAPVSARGLWPREGERWIYRFGRKASAEFGGKPWLRLSIGGRAAIEAVESAGFASHGGNRFYRMSFEVDRIEIQGEARNETRAFPGARIEIDAAGKVRELRFATTREGAPAVTEEEADLVRDLVGQWLFFENRTRLGAAEAEWSDPAKPTVTKRIARYPGRPEIARLDSNHEWARVGDSPADAKVARIAGNEDYAVGSPTGDFVQSSSYQWAWIATEKTAPAAFALGAPFAVEGETGSAAAPAESKPDPARVAREWTKLKDLAPHARLKLFRDAKRALDAGASGLVSLILKDLRGKGSTSVEWRTGVGALAATSNPEAAKALVALYREAGRTPDEKLSILSGVAAGEGAPAPEWKPTFEAALESAPAAASEPASRIAEEAAKRFDPSRDYDPDAALREATLYALGSSIRKESDANRRADLESVLWREVKDARTERDRVAVLEAIGNSGSGEYYAYVKEQFAAGPPRVRAKAVAAVRFLASDLAKPIIDRAKADPIPSVRKIAAWSEGFQAAAAPDPAE